MDSATDIDHNEQDWPRIGSYSDVDAAQEHALVVLAMGGSCFIDAMPGQDRYDLHVPRETSTRAMEEIDAYERELEETIREQPSREGPFSHPAGWGVYFLWALCLTVILYLQPLHPGLEDRGASSSIDLIEHHEWWRPLTALFLHADYEHLLGNLLSGLFFATLVSSSIGVWRGWALILTCGAIGNATVSWLVWPEAYRSIGASTAVFAALGILSGLGLAWMLRLRGRVAWLRVIAPVVAGIVVLGMTGSGLPESNTDVLGHVFGFAAGVVAGTLSGLSCRASSGTSKAESDAPT